MVDFVVGRDDFSRMLSEGLGCKYRPFDHDYHPDGEPCPIIKADYNDIKGSHVVLVLRGEQLPDYTRVSRNLHNFSRHTGNLAYIFEAGQVDVLMPYCWLGRSDKNPKTDEDALVRERDQGRDVGYMWLARAFKAQGANRIITFNPHFRRDKKGPFLVKWNPHLTDRENGIIDRLRNNGDADALLRQIPTDYRQNAENLIKMYLDCVDELLEEMNSMEFVGLSGVPALARHSKKLYDQEVLGNNLTVMGPDLSSSSLAEELSAELDTEFGGVINKKRMGGDYVRRDDKKIDVDGSEVLMVDDIYATGGTSETGRDNIVGDSGVDFLAVHGVFPEEGLKRAASLLKGKFRRIVTTDTIHSKHSKYTASVIPEIVKFYEENEKCV